MTDTNKQNRFPALDESQITDLFGYLNFSNGKPDTKFQSHFNLFWNSLDSAEIIKTELLNHLETLKKENPTFSKENQAELVIRLVFEDCLPAYRKFHEDLLFHLPEKDFLHPFFLVRIFEAVLNQAGPWEEKDRITKATLIQLNDFLGFRPLGVLENEQLMEPYLHERHCPVPCYLKGTGVSFGPYHKLLSKTMEYFENTPESILISACFDFNHMEELAIDMRAHDHLHPVNKRTNYTFGEWDPHAINTQGFYYRFIIRKIILDELLQWIDLSIQSADSVSEEELVSDAAAVLCGTILMASAVSGSGPDTHDSSVSLSSLLPKIAHQRDEFYDVLLKQATGERAKRLSHEAEITQQPFGHIRQHLNLSLANYGAKQFQHRHLAQLYAFMGYEEASQSQAAIIPSTSIRFETDILCRITSAHNLLERGEIEEALTLISQIEDSFRRGITCGAIVDPWNVLAFQGFFPLFTSRDDSIPDQRIESLYHLVEQSFSVYAHAMRESAMQGKSHLISDFSERFYKMAEQWDRYATTAVEELPAISGRNSWESAKNVADALSNWKLAGEAAGDISFWRQYIDQFQSPKAFSLVVDSLLKKNDLVASMGLIMQWLSQIEEVGIETEPYSIHGLLCRWLEAAGKQENSWELISRFYDFLEANAGEYWSVPTLGKALGFDNIKQAEMELEEETKSDEEENLFQAAYDDIIYEDSANDGEVDDTLDKGYGMESSEFDFLARYLEPRIKFLITLTQMWQKTAAIIISNKNQPGQPLPKEKIEVIKNWHKHTQKIQDGISDLMDDLWEYQIPKPAGDHDGNVEYDMQLQTKFLLLYVSISCYICSKSAERCLASCLPQSMIEEDLSESEHLVIDVYRGILERDPEHVRKKLPDLLAQLQGLPLLYVPFDRDGHPEQIRKARLQETIIRFLCAELPKLGLLRETSQVLRTAYTMERRSRPGGTAVTEFDRMFQLALKNSLECVILSSAKWRSGKFSPKDLIDIVNNITDRYLDIWLKHSSTTRLSSIEPLLDEEAWDNTSTFIKQYGADLFHARMLTLSNVRAILHNGVGSFLDFLKENSDPLHPVKLLEDLQDKNISRDSATELLTLIYEVVVDKFDRFMEYNTTSTLSDYGERFGSLLDFLRIEAAYERDAWNFAPVGIAHQLLTKLGKNDAAIAWERSFEKKTAPMAESYLDRLRSLESIYGMKLPSLADRFEERFVKPFAVNRMSSLVPQAIKEAQKKTDECKTFDLLKEEINNYLCSISGSGIDIPEWLKQLENDVESHTDSENDDITSTYVEMKLPLKLINLREMKKQLKLWNQRIGNNNKS